MIEAVMPISDKEAVRRHLDRAMMSFESLNHFWSGSQPLKIHVVMPDDEYDQVSGAISKYARTLQNIEFIFRKEGEISPVYALFPAARYGYAKQMLVKLAAFMFVQSPFYLTLDTDVVACKSFSASDLVIDGRAVTDWMVPTMHTWWHQSAAILKLSPRLDKPRIFVTPLVLSTDIAMKLALSLNKIFGSDWIMGLLARYTGDHPNIWTEYTLYDLYAEECALFEKYHLPASYTEKRLQIAEDGIWYAGDFGKWSPERALDSSRKGYFLVLQSITANDLSFDSVRQRWLEAVVKTYPSYSLASN